MKSYKELQRKQDEMSVSGLSNFKLTTVALDDNQHLVPRFHASIVETFCDGYKDNLRDKTLDGYYFTKELYLKPATMDQMGKENQYIYIQCLPKS